MSIKFMTQAWKEEEMTSSEKLVFLSICDNANDEGICYPSIKNIVKKTSLSERSVIRQIAKLEERGALLSFNRSRKTGGRYSTLYLVYPEENFEQIDEEYKEKFQKKYKEKFEISDSQTANLSGGQGQSQTANLSGGQDSQTANLSGGHTYIEPSLILEPSLKEKKEKKKKEQTDQKNIFLQQLSKVEKDLFEEYLELRKEMKLKTTESIQLRLLKKYFEFGRNIKTIEDAISSNWRDFYPPKEQQKPQNKKMSELLREFDTRSGGYQNQNFIDVEDAS